MRKLYNALDVVAKLLAFPLVVIGTMMTEEPASKAPYAVATIIKA